MGVSTRDRISVDLRGIRCAVLARAAAMGITASELVREVLAREVHGEASGCTRMPLSDRPSDRQVRVSLRMGREQASGLRRSARSAALSLGDYVSALVAHSPAAMALAPRAELAAELVRSCAGLAALARDIRHLAQLLAQGQVRAAQEYRQRLDDIEVEVRRHLRLAAEVLADLEGLRKYREGASAERGE
jgi:hypothetical protein